MGILTGLFGSGAIQSIENIATEWIETDKESAEAKSLFVKTLDPNGNMRKQISEDVTQMYKIYILLTMVLVLAQSFGIGDGENIKLAVGNLTDLFLPITGMFSSIVLASFGVNGMNAHKGI